MPPIHPLLALPLEAGETPASYVSRLAWQMRVAARAFCLDLGVNFQQVVDGELEALARLAEALRTDIGQLSGQALVRKETGYRIGSESLPRTHLARSHLRLCPACAAEDLASGLALPYLGENPGSALSGNQHAEFKTRNTGRVALARVAGGIEKTAAISTNYLATPHHDNLPDHGAWTPSRRDAPKAVSKAGTLRG